MGGKHLTSMCDGFHSWNIKKQSKIHRTCHEISICCLSCSFLLRYPPGAFDEQTLAKSSAWRPLTRPRPIVGRCAFASWTRTPRSARSWWRATRCCSCWAAQQGAGRTQKVNKDGYIMNGDIYIYIYVYIYCIYIYNMAINGVVYNCNMGSEPKKYGI